MTDGRLADIERRLDTLGSPGPKGTAELMAEVRRLRAEVARLRADALFVALWLGTLAEVFDRRPGAVPPGWAAGLKMNADLLKGKGADRE